MTIKDGGPAFPFPSGPEPRFNTFHDRCEGMTLRDWFAGNATIGLVMVNMEAKGSPQIVAGAAYMLADAMIAEREKKQ